MNWLWIIALAIVLVSTLSVARYLRRILVIFSMVFSALLLVHSQAAPTEASTALFTMGGGFLMLGPLRRIIGRGPF